MANLRIQIGHNGNVLPYQEVLQGNPQGASLQVQALDQIQWTSNDGDFGVIFSKSPFKSGATTLSGAQNTTTAFETLAHVAGTPGVKRSKKFKYVAALDVAGNPTPILLEDPELIVADSSGGGKKKAAPKKKKPAKKK
jgi:hypothetical protein